MKNFVNSIVSVEDAKERARKIVENPRIVEAFKSTAMQVGWIDKFFQDIGISTDIYSFVLMKKLSSEEIDQIDSFRNAHLSSKLSEEDKSDIRKIGSYAVEAIVQESFGPIKRFHSSSKDGRGH